MEVVLRVVEGPEKGREFRFEEAASLLVGRQDPTSKADLYISAEDQYVSRHHFTVEVRPPDCLIHDCHSTNGTFIRRQGQKRWEKIQEAKVYEGDQIKIGHTVFVVLVQGAALEATAATEAVPVPTQPLSDLPTAASPETELMCLRCNQRALAPVPDPARSNLRDVDFLCPTCRLEVEKRRQLKAEAQTEARYACIQCGRDLTHLTQASSPAATRAPGLLGLCSDCAEKAQEVLDQPLGGYQLLKRLGQGDMGVVYEAWNPHTGQLVALKELMPLGPYTRPLYLQFMREICLPAIQENDQVVRLFEVGWQQERLFCVSEFIPGGNLSQYVSEAGEPALAPPVVGGLVAEALAGLVAMHQQGCIHRSLKPENILLRPREGKRPQPVLADFSLAYSYEKYGGTIAHMGEYARAIMYMPPEQVLSFRSAQPSVDVYAMGVILYYLLTGHYPLEFPTPAELRRGARLTKDPARMILEDTPRRLRDYRPNLPNALLNVVDKAVTKELNRRFQSAREFEIALRTALLGFDQTR